MICAQCEEEVDVRERHYSRNRFPTHVFCDKKCRAEWDKAHGMFKAMSEAGRAGRSKAIPLSNRANPRRRKHHATPTTISAPEKQRQK